MNRLILVVLTLAALASGARAQDTNVFDAGKIVARSSVTIVGVSISSYAMTAVETKIAGSEYVVVQSTDGTSNFCCSFDSAASTVPASGKTCILANKDAGGGFFERSFRRWAQNLTLYCQTLSTVTSKALAVYQDR